MINPMRRWSNMNTTFIQHIIMIMVFTSLLVPTLSIEMHSGTMTHNRDVHVVSVQ